MRTTNIEWTETTWNPTTGCSKISPGCKHCYAERISKRLQSMGLEKYQNGFELTIHPEMLIDPPRWRNPRTVFVNSMSDLFHEQVPFEFVKKVFTVMNECPSHVFQILTKRSEILLEYSDYLKWSENIWMGVSVESQEFTDRIENLRRTKAQIRFLSLEPLLGAIGSLELAGIDWVIVGGESGPKSRIMKEEWAIEIKNQCQLQKVPFFFKQWGGVNKKKTGRILEGKVWDEKPTVLVK